MFSIKVSDTYEEVSKAAAEIMLDVVKGTEKPILGLATGSSPVGLYQEMIKDHKENGTSYKDIITFNLDEYCGIPKDHEQSYWTFMHENLFNELDCPEENIHVPAGNLEDEEQACVDYETELAKYTVDVQVLGIGSDGHIAFNEPGTPFDSLTHLMELTEQTRRDNARFFLDENGQPDMDQVPKFAITQGLASIMRAKKIIMIATGLNKADAVYGMLKGPKTEDCPASILQDHPEVYVFLDKDAASKL
ncbi:MAG: glucosamine-6-phosphate deaminase [Firmicutes bacterium]|jgi:glucosamine-6-phosphate deaminase|nr:glucosamine-6-phosphate deaminase [Bacillota bacterium]MBQ1715390.1 glucosamine-6-phosphate deaminase [Bacillota bacterium]MBQ1825928.1 glucosamine-6-phosphate deaminase [Bacillota bacterium]MBQ2305801.1 glucosamine-6-phosphate deaminase [Bacillota bacterium]